MYHESFLRVTKYSKNNVLKAFWWFKKIYYYREPLEAHKTQLYNPEERCEALWYSSVRRWAILSWSTLGPVTAPLSTIGSWMITNYWLLKIFSLVEFSNMYKIEWKSMASSVPKLSTKMWMAQVFKITAPYCTPCGKIEDHTYQNSHLSPSQLTMVANPF